MSTYLHERLTKTLLLEMASGMYRDGQRFLSVRDIQRVWKVSYPTILTSLRALCTAELLEPSPRSGHYLTPGFQARALLEIKKARGKPLLQTLTLQQKLRRMNPRTGGKVIFLLEVKSWYKMFPEGIFQELPEKYCSPSVIRCARSFKKESIRYGFEVEYLLYANQHHSNEQWIQALFAERDYAGVAVFHRAGCGDVASTLRIPIQKQIPIVVLYDDCHGLPVNSINLNNVGIGYDAIRNLYRQGHRRIAVLAMNTEREMKPQQNRVEGCHLAAKKLHEELELTVFWMRPEQSCSAGLRRLFINPKQRPSAILACKSQLISSLVPLFRELGLRIPNDVSVILCSSNVHVRGFGIGADTMQLNVAGKIGKIAARQLHLIQAGEPLEKSVLINVNYIRRGSVRPLSV